MKKLFSVFKHGLQKTATSISRSVSGIFSDTGKWDSETYERLEAALIGSDFGVKVSMRMVNDIRERYSRGIIKTSSDAMSIMRNDVFEVLSKNQRKLNINEDGLTVILFVGVNGSGKTTTAGKLAARWKADGKKVMLAACDTFRAAAVEQLNLWGERTGCHVISSKQGADPSSVAYDAVESALSRKADILIIDTAGRQHTKKGLMDELAKMNRTIAKVYPGAPQEVWLTVDGSIGSNAIVQAREFSNTAGLTGLVLTKLDGTGKGGMAVAIHEEFSLPVHFVGLGEEPEDLQEFDPEFYTDAIFSEENFNVL